MKKTITLDINDKPITFHIEPDDYNRFLNEMQPNNKVSPAHNFLMRTVDEGCKEELKELLLIPGAPLTIVGDLVEEYTPDLRITVGKSKRSPNSSDATP
ncbi:Phage protein [Pseudodesulfovibrio profundus]|uniref:Phage protein n=1 Tax=Pseudodesulfovibrio profundus TaxID=57320 RepID=A0A2C8FD11_9BACT|nr:putative phage tail assembly chaperone [Pseudodesulfovibrio profundus]SOB60532.1 Phage protein [Pseudodesulfovibrio profundus]